MQRIDFYQLERSAQERFIGSLDGTGLPAPIVRANPRPLEPFLWLGGAAASSLLLAVLLAIGYGNLESRSARQGPGWLVVEIALVGFAAYGTLRGAARLREQKRSPFRRGIYVFPVGLIDARRAVLHLYPIEQLVGVFGPDVRGMTLDFGAKSFAFPVRDAAEVAAVKTALTGARVAVGEAGAARESIRPKAVAALDPLQGYANPLASHESMKPERVAWDRLAWALAAGVGVVLGASLWALRNARSDDAMYARAVAASDAATYRAYLTAGSRHADEVSSLLLPRAELHDAEKAGTVEAIQAFVKDHPQKAMAAEAAAARKAALLRELDVAAKAGTLAALDELARRYPTAEIAADLARARHRVYQAALDRFVAAGVDRASPATAFVQRLIAWSEAKGPRVEVRFHHRRSKTLDRADGAAGKSPQFKGVVSLPSRYFDDAAEKGDTDALTAAIAQRFGELFPPEVLAVTPGDAVADPDAPLPAQVAVPTLFIEHGAVWAGSIQASHKPRGVFVGLELSFEALFRVPGDARPVKAKLDVWRLPELAAAADAEKPEEAVYGAMRAKGFAEFQKRLLTTLFPPAK